MWKCNAMLLYELLLHLFIVIYIGALTGAITTPLDVIKTRLMVQVFLVCVIMNAEGCFGVTFVWWQVNCYLFYVIGVSKPVQRDLGLCSDYH